MSDGYPVPGCASSLVCFRLRRPSSPIERIDWQAIGAMGEIIGAIAAVLTIGYLAVQVRENSASLERSNEIANANSISQIAALLNHSQSLLASDGEMADIYVRALANEALTAAEAVRFSAYVSTMMRTIDNLWHQQKLQLGFEFVPQEIIAHTMPLIGRLIECDVGAHWWQQDSQRTVNGELRALINSLQASSVKRGKTRQSDRRGDLLDG